jgi:hypothetical protein
MKRLLVAAKLVNWFHIVSPEKMPWWPDTVSMGVAFGVTALVIVWKQGRDREAQRRVWNSLRESLIPNP